MKEWAVLPDKYVKLDIALMVCQKDVMAFEAYVLGNIIRDYYVYYSQKKLLPDDHSDNPMMRLYFYCRPGDEQQIAYRIGLYNQAILNVYSAVGLVNISHKLPDDFPACIQVEHK